MGLSSQVAADKEIVLRDRSLTRVSKVERVNMSNWHMAWYNDTVSTDSIVNSGAVAKIMDQRQPSSHNKRYKKRGARFPESARKQSCTPSKIPLTASVSVELSEQSVARFLSDHSSRSEEHLTRVPPWRKMGLQVAIEPAKEPRKPQARVTWSDSPSQQVSYSREKKLQKWYLRNGHQHYFLRS